MYHFFVSYCATGKIKTVAAQVQKKFEIWNFIHNICY